MAFLAKIGTVKVGVYERDAANYIVQFVDESRDTCDPSWRTEYAVRRAGHGGDAGTPVRAALQAAERHGGRDLVWAVADATGEIV